MLKKILIGLAVILIVVGASLQLLWSNLDTIVRTAIVKYGTAAIGVPVSVGSVHITLAKGEGTIKGLVIGNPKGFSTPNAFEMDSISVAIDTDSIINGGTIVIKQISVEQPQVTFEVNDNGVTNLQSIMKDIKNQPASPHDAGNNPQARKVTINDFYLKNGQIKISNNALLHGKTVNAPLSSIHLTNLGGEDGSNPADIAKQLVANITSVSIRDASTGLTKQLRDLGVNNAVKSGSDTLKGLLGR